MVADELAPCRKTDDVMFGHMRDAKSFVKRVKLPADLDGGAHHAAD